MWWRPPSPTLALASRWGVLKVGAWTKSKPNRSALPVSSVERQTVRSSCSSASMMEAGRFPAAASKVPRPPACHGVPARLSRLVPVVVYGETYPRRAALPCARTQGAIEAAYDREEMLEARREWMEKWAQFVSGADAASVTPLRA